MLIDDEAELLQFEFCIFMKFIQRWMQVR